METIQRQDRDSDDVVHIEYQRAELKHSEDELAAARHLVSLARNPESFSLRLAIVAGLVRDVEYRKAALADAESRFASLLAVREMSRSAAREERAAAREEAREVTNV